MAQQIINIGSAYKDPDADKSRDAFDKINDMFTELYSENINKYTINNIGGWNMDSTASVSLTITIPDGYYPVGIEAFIRRDDQLYILPIHHWGSVAADVSGCCYLDYSTSTWKAHIERFADGFFDDAAYNDDSINRGYYIVRFIALS